MAGAAVPAAGTGGPAIIELRYIRMRNGSQTQRTSDFLNRHYLPAARRAAAGPTGCFSAVIGEQSPFVLVLASYPSFAAFGDALEKIAADKDFRSGFDEYNSMAELSYMRIENALLRGFESMPQVVVPPARKAPRIFELRTYESNNAKAGATKIRMFNQGEIGIFKRLGMQPVFFGEMLVGSNLPNLTYMLSFDSLAEREKLWAAFGGDPEWKKMRAVPEYADALIVSNISNSILRPLPFSEIR